jgi:hypothetical protein
MNLPTDPATLAGLLAAYWLFCACVVVSLTRR